MFFPLPQGEVESDAAAPTQAQTAAAETTPEMFTLVESLLREVTNLANGEQSDMVRSYTICIGFLAKTYM